MDYEAPEFVKQATAEQQGRQGTDELYDRQFADTAYRRYPMHTKAATWLSMACFFTRKDAAQKDPHTAKRLQEQAELFQIATEFDRLKTAAAAPATTAAKLPDECYAYFVPRQKDSLRWLPIVDAADIPKVANYLQKFAARMPRRQREQIAMRTLNRAETLQADMPAETRDYLHKIAGIGLADPDAVRAMLYQRASVARNLRRFADADEFEKLANAYEKHPYAHTLPQQQEKLLTLVSDFDEENQLTRRYGFDLVQPELAVHAITKQALAEARDNLVGLVTGSTYTKQALADLTLSDIRDNLGEQIATEVSDDGLFVNMTKLAEILPTLPRPDATTFDRLLAERGQNPVIKSSAAVDEEDIEGLQELATVYLASRISSSA